MILAVAEVRDGQLRPVSREVVTAARSLADALDQDVEVLVLGGPGASQAAGDLGRFGADAVHVAESDSLARYSGSRFCRIVAGFIGDNDCGAVVFPATAMGKDLAPRVAARLGVGYASECTELNVVDGELQATRPRYAGKAFATVAFEKKPAVVSIRPNLFMPVERPAAGTVEALPIADVEIAREAIVKEVRAAAGEKLEVGEAKIVVSGGRGLRDPDNFKLLEELAQALGAAVGASRAVVDAGWRPHAEQVGQTGKTVSPQLYFAVGISGAIQHLAGMRTSRYIVAINKDPEAPIFKVADYGIVGDLFEVLPALTEEVRKLRQ